MLIAQICVFARQLNVRAVSDEANYILSAQALADGEALGRDIFISQPPGFFVLLEWLLRVFGDSLQDARAGMIAIAAVGTVALFFIGKQLVSPLGGIASAALVTITAPLAIDGFRVYADTPAYALGAVAIAFAAARRPGLVGAFLALAISCKLSGVIAIPTALVLLYLRSNARRRDLGLCGIGFAAVGVAYVVAYAHDLRQIWQGTVSYHLDAHQYGSLSASHSLSNFASPRAAYTYLIVLGMGLTLVRARHLWPLWLWPASGIGFILLQRPLHENHLLVLPYTFAGAAGPALATVVEKRPPRLVPALVAVGAVAVVVGYIQQVHRTDLQPKGQEPNLVRAARALDRVTTAGSLVVTDQGIVAVMAHRHVPGQLADSSALRFQTRTFTPQSINRIIATQPIDAVIIGRTFTAQPTIMSFAARTYAKQLHLPHVTIYYSRRRSQPSLVYATEPR